MGLIIFIGILLSIYLVKIINPEFIVGVAETESIVRVGNYIDTHKWAYYLATSLISFIVYWLICCACCRKKFLNWKECIIILFTICILFVCEKYANFLYMDLNIISQMLLPAIFCLMDHKKDIKYYYSSIFCLSIHFIAQTISLQIRNIITMIAQYNYATLIVMMIDVYIWLFIMYFYFNFKKENK
jgi:hypothetical protein